MATRSHIGLRTNLNETVDYIYCHWDGYPEHNGIMLTEYYQTIDKVNQLLELGDISVLGKNWCLAYGRDRGESNTSKRNMSFDDLIKDGSVDYVYVFDGDYWECYNTSTQESINLYELAK